MQNYQLQRQLEICHSELETLKEQIELLEKEKGALEQTIIILKKQRLMSDSENRKLFQENEKNRQLVEKLKIDNKSMEMEIQKFRAERKVYYNNLGSIQNLKRDIQVQLAQKNALIDQTNSKLRKIERNHSECRLKIEDLQRIVNQTEIQKRQLREELKINLEKFLSTNNLLTKMEYQLKQSNQLNKQFKQKIYQLEKEREQFMVKLGYDVSDSQGNLSSSKKSNYQTHQRSMLQIQSYMKEIQNVLDLKREELDRKQKNYDKLKISIDCLEKLL